MRFNKSKLDMGQPLKPIAGETYEVPAGAKSYRLGFITIIVESRKSGVSGTLLSCMPEERRAEVEAQRARENTYVLALRQPHGNYTR